MTMTDMQRSAVIATLVKEFRARNAFCGETHVQKSVYFMQQLLGAPLGFEYLLYIYGPFSFELQSHLAGMRADDLITVRPLDYGATFEPGDHIAYVEQHLPKTIAKYRDAIDFAVRNFARVGVKQLEQLATALYFTNADPDEAQEKRADRIVAVKPHIRAEEALRAVRQIDEWRETYAAHP